MKEKLELPRLPWSQMNSYVSLIESFFVGETYFFGGSWRRHCPTCGDIDMAVLRSSTMENCFDRIKDLYPVQPVIYGSAMKRWVITLPDATQFKLDVWVSEDTTGWGPMCCFVAGDGIWNAMQRKIANSKGFTLGFYLKQGGSIIPCETEKDVYNLLGMSWRDYPARSFMKK